MKNPINTLSSVATGSILVTGAAGFIGFTTAKRLLDMGKTVIGVDSLSDYYEVSLKKDRLKVLKTQYPQTFHFHQGQIEDKEAMERLWGAAAPEITHIVHLAAQAGVRHSLTHPYEYVTTNVMGYLVLLELARHQGSIKNFVYASTSSVYGANKKLPFAEEDRTDSPMALYAATKKCDELMSQAYAHLFRLPLIGLRFFSVYGPWGRPDMALFIFTKKILEGSPITVYNQGNMHRDFTYVDDIVEGITLALANPPLDPSLSDPHKIYNLGNSKNESLSRYIELIEENLGKKAKIDYLPIQPGDVPGSLSDTLLARTELGFNPKTNIEEGVANFIQWYKQYYRV